MFFKLKNQFKIQRLMILLILILILIVLFLIYSADFGNQADIEYGVTYSAKYADQLGIDWQDTYVNLIDDMHVRKFRLMAYWDEIQPTANEYDYSRLDWLVSYAQQNQSQVIMVVGRRQPRWPECHQAAWVEELSVTDQEQAELDMIRQVVEHYKDFDNIVAWQVDNEPFLSVFGECPPVDKDFYEQKLALVKSLDDRPAIVTESGELSSWYQAARLNPIVGTSIYRNTWNKWYGNFYYPLPPAYYYFKAQSLKQITPLERVFVSELQLEPWADEELQLIPIEKQKQTMSISRFEDNLHYVQRIGFDEIYLWGAEWWYWMKIKHADDSYWEAAKKVFN